MQAVQEEQGGHGFIVDSERWEQHRNDQEEEHTAGSGKVHGYTHALSHSQASRGNIIETTAQGESKAAPTMAGTNWQEQHGDAHWGSNPQREEGMRNYSLEKQSRKLLGTSLTVEELVRVFIYILAHVYK